MNPESQSNSTLLGNTVDSPEEEPFMGFDKRPQSTAIEKKNNCCNCVFINGKLKTNSTH